jgi:OmpA-OmpF porin, OOP family
MQLAMTAVVLFSLQTFRPAVDSKGYVTVDASQILGHLDFSLGLVGSYAHDVLDLEGGGAHYTVEHYLTPQLQFAIGLFKWVELGLTLPVHIMYGTTDAGSFSGQFVGDIGLHAKTRLLSSSKYPVGLGLLFSVYAPSGDASKFLGEGQTTLRPELILDKEFGRARRFRLSLNAGLLVRPSTHTFTDAATMQTRALGTQFAYGLGAAYAVVPQRFELVAEGTGYAGATPHSSPLEAVLAAKVYLAAKSYFEIGGSAGTIPGQTGSPDFRVFVGFIFEPAIGDRDGDGIKDDVDKCPDEPEDFDDFEDEDGCPDPDNDHDGILDRDDQCPNEPGPVENHGCPWPPPPPPPPPPAPEPPPPPPAPPPPPPEPPKQLTRLRRGAIETMSPIFFETAKAIIKPISYPTLDAVAETMRANPQLLIVEVQGHADERGDDDYNMRLTEDRAAAVVEYLVKKGVDADRLRSHGYGETKPVCHRHDEPCWSKNRRVEFVILRRSDNPL